MSLCLLEPKSVSVWYSADELAGIPGMPKINDSVNRLAKLDKWDCRQEGSTVRGRPCHKYHISFFPRETIDYLVDKARGQEIKPNIEIKIDPAVQFKKTEKDYLRINYKRKLLSLVVNVSIYEEVDFNQATVIFAEKYNSGEIEVDSWVRDAHKTVHKESLIRWKKAIDNGDTEELSGNYGNRKGKSIIDDNEDMMDLVIGMITGQTSKNNANIMNAVRARFARTDAPLPSFRSLQRWVKKYKEKNHQAITAITNPDKWKNKYKVAFGSASEHIVRMNQLWEFDSTPADVMLKDGRHSIVGAIDVYTRRTKLVVSRTSNSGAISKLINQSLIDWGVPEIAKTDNGQDYISYNTKRIFDQLSIEHHISAPFSPWEKPHIERFFKTFSHGLMELLPGYIGHNVSDRKELECRKSFSERLFTKNEVIAVEITSEELQIFCDRWLNSFYNHAKHSGLKGKTPFQKASEWSGGIKAVDAKALDIITSSAPNGHGFKTVSKKGISVDNIKYISPELSLHIGDRVRVIYNEEHLDKLYVFDGEGDFICIAEAPEYSGVSRNEVAAKAKYKQNEFIKEQKKKMKQAATKSNVKDIADEILDQRESDNASLIQFPKSTHKHQTESINAAGEAAKTTSTTKVDNVVTLNPPPKKNMRLKTIKERMQTEPGRWNVWLENLHNDLEDLLKDEDLKREINGFLDSSEFNGRYMVNSKLVPTNNPAVDWRMEEDLYCEDDSVDSVEEGEL